MASTTPSGYLKLGISNLQAQRLSSLSTILNTLNPMATDANTLLETGKCYQCLGIGPGDIVELALLDLINENIGGGGGGTGLSGAGSPEGVTAAAVGASYVDINPPYDVWFKVSGAGNTGWVMKVE